MHHVLRRLGKHGYLEPKIYIYNRIPDSRSLTSGTDGRRSPELLSGDAHRSRTSGSVRTSKRQPELGGGVARGEEKQTTESGVCLEPATV